jgi:hypothetical protein
MDYHLAVTKTAKKETLYYLLGLNGQWPPVGIRAWDISVGLWLHYLLALCDQARSLSSQAVASWF